jgi:hypothetical protein
MRFRKSGVRITARFGIQSWQDGALDKKTDVTMLVELATPQHVPDQEFSGLEPS